MLTRTENRVMGAIYSATKGKAALISPADLIRLSGVEGLTLKSVEEIVKNLAYDGYFDLVYSDRKGETVYCVTLTEKGKGFPRSGKMLKRTLIFRLGLTVCLAVFSFLLGLLLKAIFKG